ncbi:MAG: nucleoside kinase [Treponema sp.]|nr:nucleoside kinase [Candidatus Treponema equifaecale]
MGKITLTFTNDKSITVEARIRGRELLSQMPGEKKDVVAIKVDNEILSLCRPIKVSSRVEPVYLNTKEGAAIYRRSLCFVLAAAANKLFPGVRLLVGHSLGYGYYYTLESGKPVTEAQISSLQDEMKKIIEKNVAILTKHISYDEAVSALKKFGLTESLKQLEFVAKREILVNYFDDVNAFCDLYFDTLVESTGCLKTFELKPYGEGFLLRFPKHGDHSVVPEFKDNPKIFEIYQNYKKWGKMVHVTSVASLNALTAKKKTNDFIDICETFQAQNYAKVAQQIRDRGNVKVVLIAGPSSSGKTTSAYKMSLHLRALGYNPKVISLDDYYAGHDKTPRDENGNLDFECLEALNVDMLNQNLVDLFDGKEIELPAYNFDCGQSYMSGKFMKLEENDILIMEGIHGLNDKLTPLVKPEYKFKIYLSALTQLNLDDHNRVPTSDNRLIRRIVRDANFRGKPAAGTIAMWDSVQKGEQLHIFPFQNNADAVLNTALDYELPVLKVYAEPMLRAVKPSQKEYTEAVRLLSFLENFSPIPADYVPKQSIIREFIGGSSFKY